MIGAKTTLDGLAEAIRAAFAALNPSDRRLALRLYRLLLAGKPVTSSRLASSLGAEMDVVEAALGRWPGVFSARKGRVLGFWGLSVRGMPHRMLTREGNVTTWCALDPLFIAPLVTDKARVESANPASGAPIAMTVMPHCIRDLDPPGAQVPILSPDGPFSHDVVEKFCRYIHFFASVTTGERWVVDHPGTYLLTVDEALELGTRFRLALFGVAGEDPRMRYER